MIKISYEKNMYKLITVDLDGTLLNKMGAVTPKTKEVLKNVINKGTEVIIASGRPISSIKNIAKEINSENYFIAGNGAVIYDIKKDEILYGKFLTKEKVLAIIKICEENSIYYNLYTTNEIISKSLKYNVLYYYKENQDKAEHDKTRINIIQDIYKYVEESEEKFLKITICDENKSIFDAIIRKIKDTKGIEVLDVEHMSRKLIKDGTETVEISYFYTEITLKDTDKWTAIEYLINKLGIKKEEVIAIGDNMNDKRMIKSAGMGIAMLGSTPRIIEVANKVTTESNDDNGVAKILEEIYGK